MKEFATRLPNDIGKGALPQHAGVKTPWEKVISFHDAYHYANRQAAAIGAGFADVCRILVPDYVTRNTLLANASYANMYRAFAGPFGKIHSDNHEIPPFMNGACRAPLFGDCGDERLVMCGRVTDWGPGRVEKELDTCPWDIVGSEVCRISAYITEGIADAMVDGHGGGPRMEYNMVEARGCGDLHCRFLIESRDKYPMPERPVWDHFGPVATADQIKYTPEEQMEVEPQQFREECDYHYFSALACEHDAADFFNIGGNNGTTMVDYANYMFNDLIAKGEFTEDYINNVITSVFNYAGKMMFVEPFAKEGIRSWLGVPHSVNDGRILGAYMEVIFQILKADYEVVEFSDTQCVYNVAKAPIQRRFPNLITAYTSLWYGMARTLLGAEWFCWRETEDVPDDTLRMVIGKKIDKFCI